MTRMNKETAILSARLAHLCINSRLAIFTALILAVILAYTVHGTVASSLIFCWLVLVVLISLVRVAMAEKYQRSPDVDYPTLQARLRNFRFIITLAGVVWGSTGILMFPASDSQHQVFLIFILAGMSTAVIVAYAADIFSAAAFGLTVLSPLVVRLFMTGDSFSLAMGVAGTLYIGFIIGSLFYSNKRILENLTLHFEASEREEAIRESDDWHRSLLNRAMDGFWLTDMQGKLLQVNETYCRMSGYGEQELLTMHIQELEAIETVDGVISHLQKIKADGEDRFETMHRRKDGTLFDVEVGVQYRAADGGRLVVFLQDITERKQTEAALLSSEAHLRTIIDNEPECIKIVDAHGRLKQMNPAGLAMIEADSLAQMAGHSLLEVVAPEHRMAFAGLHKRVIAGESGQLEFEVVGLKGGRRWLETHAVPMQEHGETMLLGVTRDITRRKQAEEALRESEFRWKFAIEGSGDCVWDTNEVDRTITFSKTWKEMLGYSEHEDMNSIDEWESLIHPEDKMSTLTNVQDCLDGKIPTFVCEYRILCKDGSYKWMLDRGVIVSRNKDGKPLRMLGTSSDISKRKQMEEALRESEFRWKFAIEGSGDGVWDVNVQTEEAKYSKRWKEMLGYSEEDIMEHRHEWINRIHPQDKAKVLAAGQAYLEGLSDSYVVEYRLQCKDGSYKWMLSRGMIVSHDQNGKPLRVIGTQTDITERKTAQLALQQTRTALEESHDRFKDLYEFAPIGYLTISKHGLITQLNWRASAMLGMDRKHIIHKRFAEFIDESDKGRWSRMFLAMKDLASGEEYSFDLKFHLHNQMTFHANLNCARMSDEDEQSMLRVTLEDITMVKKSEADLRIAATAFESQDGLMITDAENKILKVNKAFSAITGYSDEEVVGKSPSILASGRHDASFFSAMWDTLDKTGHWTGEIWNRRKSGDIYPENLTISAVKADNGIVTNYVGTFTDTSMMKAAAEEIQQLAFYDSLTQLPNRRLLMDRLKHALATIGRSGRQGAVLFLDLDHFKVLNDSLGHDIGDLLLQQVASRLTACVREGDTVARLGGDEYVVVLEDLSEQSLEAAAQTETIANKILAALNQPYQLNEHEHHITPSIGIALFNNHQITIEELLKQADIAMYQAKKAGRNTMRFFNPQMQISITARVALERELRKALENKQLQLYYQIQVDNSGHVLGAEALIRWLHPERGLVSPAQFIQLAEETGLIMSIGHWVLDTACAQIKAWHKHAHTRDLTLSINVSAKQFRQPDFVAQVRAAIERHSIDPMQLKLELTESLLLENIEDTISSMTVLGEIGVQFSLDDFGTGYSSLQYLKRLPLFQLKIDQSFVRDIVTDSHDRSIVRTIIAMAQSLYLNVIAEGVETEEQRELLLSNGCKRYQGYLFGRPVPIDQFNAALKQGVAGKKVAQLERS